MIPTYQHTSIWINGREVSLNDICLGKFLALDNFELNTFQFIQDWLTTKNNFNIQTSGSTGPPKVISFTRQQLVLSAAQTLEALNIANGANALVCLDTKYIAGRMMLVRSFLANLRIFAITPTGNIAACCPPSVFFELTAMVPLQVYQTLEHHPDFFNSCNNVLIGGAPLSKSAQFLLADYACKVFTTYGMTETISHVALHRVDKSNEEIFQALPNIALSQDERNCLVIKAPYLKSTIYTNDIIELVTPASFKWLGRWDNIINTGGFKVIPEKTELAIQKVLTEQNIHNPFFIGAIPDNQLGQQVTLFIEGYQGFSRDELKHWMSLNITVAEVPREIICLEKFSKTENGKIDRKSTIAQYLTGKLNRLKHA